MQSARAFSLIEMILVVALLGPLVDFRKSFPPIFLTSLLAVVLLSVHQIRKSLVPLERLQAGTQRITMRDFSTRVEIDSGDEFEQLAGAFNSMAERLGRQFGALKSMNAIVQGVLSALDSDEIVRSILEHFDALLPCQIVSVRFWTIRLRAPPEPTGEVPIPMKGSSPARQTSCPRSWNLSTSIRTS
jgi:prepilin-type N-terminal cleavage/methylation domain-containing protein